MKIRRCIVCGRYTMKKACCGKGTKSAHPKRWVKKKNEMIECLKAS